MKQYGDPKGDKWYQWQGVKPPERTPHGVKEDEIESKIKEQLENHKCQWKQRGPDIFCDSGDNEHGIRIGTDKHLKETGKNGEPILIDV